jgi:hypothetical protein
LRVPPIDPVVAVVAFVALGTLLSWGIVQAAGPGRPSDSAVLLSVAAPVLVALACGWLLARSSEDD